MKKIPSFITSFLKAVFIEVFIIFIYIFVINNYIGNVDVTLKADAEGYYDYLPSIFIHHDLVRKDTPIRKDSARYRHIKALGALYVDYHGLKVNKCPCGTALLELPFFTYPYLTTHRDGTEKDGYQLPFQTPIFYAALFYLFLTIFFLKKILKLYDIKSYIIILTQLFLVLATGVTHYANYDAGYSHVFSLFAITAFIYFIASYFRYKNLNHFIFACIFFGLILILRQINILIILFVPFLAGSLSNLKEGCLHLLRNPIKLIIGVFSVIAVFSIQCLLWYLQTGNLLIYSYQGEGFNFSHPHMYDILFSYRKGLFVYAPILFISLFGLIWLAYKRKYYLIFAWLSFFLILTYVYSSWWTWVFGCSYGMRVFVDFYAVFFILFALMMNGVGSGMRSVIILLSFLTIPVNIIQTYQYKEYILHWINMDKQMYWKVFLKTDKRYKGLVWKRSYDYNHTAAVKEISIGNITTVMNTDRIIYKISSRDIPEFNSVYLIQVLFDNDFYSKNDSKVIVSIYNAENNYSYYSYAPYLIDYSLKDLNEWQTGLFNYEIDPFNDPAEKIITLEVKSVNQNNILKNVKLRFLKYV